MIRRRRSILIVATTLILGIALHAQTPTLSRNVIVLDPAHGGADTGARTRTPSPKRTSLSPSPSASGRSSPPLALPSSPPATPTPPQPRPPFTSDQRAGIANHPHALACILIHATPSGSGVHIFTSTLPPDANPDPNAVLPWDSAQSAYLPLSLRLARQLGVSLLHSNIPPLLGHASIRPLDNLTCPAVAIEIAPLVLPDANPTLISDATYQQHIAQAIVAALTAWRNEAAPPTQPATPSTPRPITTPPRHTAALLPPNPRPLRQSPPEPPRDSTLSAHPLLDSRRLHRPDDALPPPRLPPGPQPPHRHR